MAASSYQLIYSNPWTSRYVIQPSPATPLNPISIMKFDNQQKHTTKKEEKTERKEVSDVKSGKKRSRDNESFTSQSHLAEDFAATIIEKAQLLHPRVRDYFCLWNRLPISDVEKHGIYSFDKLSALVGVAVVGSGVIGSGHLPLGTKKELTFETRVSTLCGVDLYQLLHPISYRTECTCDTRYVTYNSSKYKTPFLVSAQWIMDLVIRLQDMERLLFTLGLQHCDFRAANLVVDMTKKEEETGILSSSMPKLIDFGGCRPREFAGYKKYSEREYDVDTFLTTCIHGLSRMELDTDHWLLHVLDPKDNARLPDLRNCIQSVLAYSYNRSHRYKRERTTSVII
jgi:hypothetical protein